MEKLCRKIVLGCAVFVGVVSFCASAAVKSRPNVVIIYGDDVGYGDVGIYGAEKIPTPNIDRLAGNGLMFTDGHCAASTCTPSRFAMLTGSSAFRHKGTGVLPGDAAMAIRPDMFTLSDLFKKAGYATAAIGKWHLGLGDGHTPIDWNGEVAPGPQDIGFDVSFLLPATNDRVPCVYLRNRRVVGLEPDDPITVSYRRKIPSEYPDGVEHPEAMTFYKSTHGHNNSVINGIGRIGWMSGGTSALWNDETIADELLKEAQAFIKTHRSEPFFLYFASQDIHVPRVPHPRFRGKSGLGYRGDAMVQFDWTTGEILKTLERFGLAEKTIVIFSSDNGPVYNDGYDDGTTVHTSTEEVDCGHDGSGIYRGGKYQIYEGGTRVPLIISWPGTIEPGVSGALVSQVDFMASFAELLDFGLPEKSAVDSRNVLPILLGMDNKSSGEILEQSHRGRIALRSGEWKLIPGRPRMKRERTELYNLTDDPGEQNNLAGQFPERVVEMTARLEKIKATGLRSVEKAKVKQQVDVYLLGGQSNMQGVADVSKIPAGLGRVPGMFCYYGATVFGVDAPNTLHDCVTPAGGGGKPGWFGPEVGFANRMKELRPDATIALIKYAKGGTSLIKDWNPGADASDIGTWGPQFDGFVRTVTNGLAALRAAGYEPRIVGILWQQGEQDAKNGWERRRSPPVAIAGETDAAAQYQKNLIHFISRVREQFAEDIGPDGLRVVLGTVLPYAPPGGDVEKRFTEREKIIAAQLKVGKMVEDVETVHCDEKITPTNAQIIDGFRDTDEVHLSARGQLTLGRLMAEKMVSIHSR